MCFCNQFNKICRGFNNSFQMMQSNYTQYDNMQKKDSILMIFGGFSKQSDELECK